jgi:hypothetical protein
MTVPPLNVSASGLASSGCDTLFCFPASHLRTLGRCATWLLLLCMPAGLSAQQPTERDAAELDFARDIQPILANHCWSCHGPDEQARQAELRLDLRDSAVAAGAIKPGDAAASALVHRIDAEDAEQVMPPPESKKPLSEAQKELLRRWVAEGAEYAQHWSFLPPIRHVPPAVNRRDWPRTELDYFVLQRLEREGLEPAPAADRATLLRRASLDLTGLPPTLEELAEFLSDTSPEAYEKAIDRLLDSPHYAERMAMDWLDLARYADTNGYNNDEDRTMWPWRDWVIRAFDQNMPFDQFLVEQLAGDLLPEPTRDQLIATAFLRNQGHNTEGGIIVEEYRVEYVADRVHTAATVFLGLSMQCARCHDHKFDPISQTEYYSFFAFFNSLDEKQASYSKFVAAVPFIRVPTAEQEQRQRELDNEIQQLQQRIERIETEADQRLADWIEAHSIEEWQRRFGPNLLYHLTCDMLAAGKVVGNAQLRDGHAGQAFDLDGQTHWEFGNLGDFDGSSPYSISVWVHPTSSETGAILSKMDEAAHFRGYDLLLEGGKLAAHLISKWPQDGLKIIARQPLTLDAWHHVLLTYDGSRKAAGLKIYVDGKLQEVDVSQDKLSGSTATDKPFHVGLRERSLPFRGGIDELKLFAGILDAAQAEQLFLDQPLSSLSDVLRAPAAERPAALQTQLRQHYLTQLDTEYPAAKQQLAQRQKERTELEDALPAVSVMKEMDPPRETFLLKRGQYDAPADKVEAGVPAVLAPLPDGVKPDRLALARWLVSPNHPLTARVAVNRWWANYFGTGLVKTVEDFGVTGEVPSHPELLDYLATQLIDNQWNVKRLQKQIVMSATYCQDSRISEAALQRDPENRLLARGPRFRLAAELVRDNALAISGLLRPRVGGPSVKPYQPAGLWEDVTVERRGKYVPDEGEGLYRRSMYTFWKRTCPPPALMNFDAPNREVCLARRARTNTPLQSLVLLNDPTYVEAARALAASLLTDKALGEAERLQQGFRRVVARDATADELAIMLEILESARQRFQSQPEAARALLAVGQSPAAEVVIDSIADQATGQAADATTARAAELASWTVVASTLLNLDETISKR